MNGLVKRIVITLAVLVVPLAVGLLFTYQIIHIDWVSFMEIQPSFRPMEDPLPLPPQSVPVEGIVYIPGAGSPTSPIPSDSASVGRGQALYEINCAICHGATGKGDGPLAESLARKPADLSAMNAAQLSEGEIFMVLTNGVRIGPGRKGGMPALRENLSIADRWDVVNYVRSLQQPGSYPARSAGIQEAAPEACPVYAIDLIGAWVAAKTPETEAFSFTDINGKTCQATFSADVLPLFSQANLWYTGALSCRTCHGPDVQISYARMDLSSYQGILAGMGRASASEKGDDILGGGNWEQALLYNALSKGQMPPEKPAGVNPKGPLIYVLPAP
jgi:mono/diheme cytochrome c family protein